MCVPVHIDNARKCSEARRLKDFVQHKCSISDTRPLCCTPSLCLSKTQGFPSMFFPKQYQFQIKRSECPACETQTSPRDCWNERFVVIFIILPPDNNLLLVSVFCKAGRGAQEEQIDEWRWIKVVVPWGTGSYSACFVCNERRAVEREEHWQTYRCGCCWWAVLPSMKRQITVH